MIDTFLKMQTSIRKRMKNAKICVDFRQVSEEASIVKLELSVVALELSVVALNSIHNRS
jgi:hypothetical protein